MRVASFTDKGRWTWDGEKTVPTLTLVNQAIMERRKVLLKTNTIFAGLFAGKLGSFRKDDIKIEAISRSSVRTHNAQLTHIV